MTADIYEPLHKAIFEITRRAKGLGKSERNDHGNYKFVPIDRFYETVGKLAAEQGLGWVLREVECQHIDHGKGAMRFTYDVDLIHVTGAAHPGFSRITIIHPIQGAQTAGSAMSYADKVFMRQCFKIPTGEEDADWSDPRALDVDLEPRREQSINKTALTQEEPEEAELDTNGDTPMVVVPRNPDWHSVEAIFKTWIPQCRDKDELQQFWSENLLALGRVKDHDATMHKKIVAMFTKRKRELMDD